MKSVLTASTELVAFFLSSQGEQGSTTNGLNHNSGPTDLLTFDPRQSKLHTEELGAFYNSPSALATIVALREAASSSGPQDCCFLNCGVQTAF